MGRLRRLADGNEIRIVNEFRIGRAPLSELRLTDSRVSGQHALLRFGADGWLVRDLASTNGTWVDGRRLATGETCSLAQGAVLAFGHEGESWILADDRAPTAAILAVGDPQSIIETREGMLSLPRDDAPEVVLLRERDGLWKLEDDAREFHVVDGQTFVVGGKAYIFSDGRSSGKETERVQPGAPSWSLTHSRLRFIVSRDEEEVELELKQGQHSLVLHNRSHFYMLLVLARTRVRDESDSALPPSLAGWVYADELAESLKVSKVGLNLFVHRLRRDFAAAGVVDPAHLIQRRQRVGELRIGLDATQIELSATTNH